MSEEGDLEFNPGGDGEPVKCVKDGRDMFKFSHSHQDPRSAVLNILQSLKTRIRDPDEKCITIVQSGGDKGVDQLFGIA